MRRTISGVALLALPILTGCAGVPTLSPENKKPSGEIIDEVVDQINCEIQHSKHRADMIAGHYLVSVNLTLQVDDTLSATPSVSEIEPIKKESSNANKTIGLSGEYTNQRERTFTTTYTIDPSLWQPGKFPNGCSITLKDKPDLNTVTTSQYAKGLYTLTGDIGINEVIQDGFDAKARGSGIIQAPSGTQDKTGPSFASTVKFTLTRAVTPMGITWNITHWKGPAGSNGLGSWKRIDTDTVVITFAPAYVNSPKTPGAQQAATDAKKALAAATVEKNAANAKLTDATKALPKNFGQIVTPYSMSVVIDEKTRERLQAYANAQKAVQDASKAVDEAKAQSDQADADLTAAKAEDKANPPGTHDNSRDMLTNVLLQNLTTRQ